jgi:GPH family glycoside/pentoside/hexuronide:cation symporter
MFLFMPFLKKIVDKYGKKEASAVGALVSLCAGALMFIFPLIPDKTISMIFFVFTLCIFGVGLGIYTCVSWALMADAIDYNEWKNGAKEEGTVYSLHSFFRKLAQGLGPSLVVIIMGALGYVGADKGNQVFEVAERMKWLVAGLYSFSAIVMFVSITFIYNLNKKKVAKMQEDLKARRGENTKVAQTNEVVEDKEISE